MPTPTPRFDVHLDAEAWRSAQADDARRSLQDDPPWLDPVWFYDEHGSDLFDEITRLPEYYPTRSERALLAEHAPSLAGLGIETLIELGSGTSDKTTTILDALVAAGSLTRYVPFDVSEDTLRHASHALADRYPSVAVHGIVGDFNRHLDTIPAGPNRLLAFLGSTIGNLQPTQRKRFLADLRATLHPGDHLLLGVDLVKDPATLVRAYDDAVGVTAAFNKNCLCVLNQELGATFDPAGFDHHAVWNPEEAWIEMRLRANRDQAVSISGIDGALRFATGDEIRTEISAKFTVEGMTQELAEAGFATTDTWLPADHAFAVLIAAPTG